MTLELFISLAGTVVSLIVTTITFIAKFIKSNKAKNIAQNVVELGNAIIPLISQAEKLVHYTGEDKKEYVMTLIRQYAFNKNLSFDYQEISEKVDELISLTKEVNVKEDFVTTNTVIPPIQNAITKEATIVNKIL